MQNQPPAFTLIEMVLVIALIVVVLTLTAPIAWSFVVQNDLGVSTAVVGQELSRAQSLAAANIEGGGWGVEISGDQIILFQGNNFSGRNLAFDEVFGFPASLGVSGATEVDFSPESGTPSAPTAITLTDSLGESANINVNAIGMVSY